MKEIRTVIHTDAKAFDTEVNQLLRYGWELDYRSMYEGGILYAELSCENNPSDDDLDGNKSDDSGKKDLQDLFADVKVRRGYAPSEVDVPTVLDVMSFIKWCCDCNECCQDCPLDDICQSSIPTYWRI